MAKSKVSRVCSLCNTEQRLVKAHIIPESFYKELYDSGHKFNEIKDQNLDRLTRRSSGLYDTEILCQKCDNELSRKYDDYGAKVFWGYHNLKLEIRDYFDSNDPRVRWRVVKNVDVVRLKIFLLSILWRASLSKLDFFKSVDLGSHHSSKLKDIITKGVSTDDYSILLIHYATDEPIARRVLSSIFKHRSNGKIFYSALICGIMVI